MVRRARKIRLSGSLRFVMFLMMIIIAAYIYKSVITPGNHQITEIDNNDKTILIPRSKEPNFNSSISPDRLNSSNAILIRLKDGAVLMKKNSGEKIYPASLTKMMTAIIAIENLSDLDEKIQLNKSMFDKLYKADASMAGFLPGEQVRAIDLLYGAMLPSGAECCIALADHIAGSERDFVKLMNQKAEAIGMNNTHFENATGLHDENHYTTVEDLAVLLMNALRNDTFRKIFTTFRHSTPPTDKHPDGITFYNTMYERLDDQNIIDGQILGGKTGYTDKAGLCLASLAKVGMQEYILITAGAKGNHDSEQYNITDALAVYNSIGK